jgi:hypothetical protein
VPVGAKSHDSDTSYVEACIQGMRKATDLIFYSVLHHLILFSIKSHIKIWWWRMTESNQPATSSDPKESIQNRCKQLVSILFLCSYRSGVINCRWYSAENKWLDRLVATDRQYLMGDVPECPQRKRELHWLIIECQQDNLLAPLIVHIGFRGLVGSAFTSETYFSIKQTSSNQIAPIRNPLMGEETTASSSWCNIKVASSV